MRYRAIAHQILRDIEWITRREMGYGSADNDQMGNDDRTPGVILLNDTVDSLSDSVVECFA